MTKNEVISKLVKDFNGTVETIGNRHIFKFDDGFGFSLYNLTDDNIDYDALVRQVMEMRKEQETLVEKIHNTNPGTNNIRKILINKKWNDGFDIASNETFGGDLMVAYMVDIGDNCAIKITNGLLETWGVTLEDLGLCVKEPTPLLLDMETAMFGSRENNNILDTDERIQGGAMYVLTSEESIHGASVVLNNGLLAEIAERVGGDYYLIPSSIHEWLILADDGTLDANELTAMIKDVNEIQVLPKEWLGDHVYRYSDIMAAQ